MNRHILYVALLAAIAFGCASPTDPHTPRLIFTDPTKYFLRTLHLSEYDEGFDVAELPDGGFIFAGSTWMAQTASTDVLLVRTDVEGIVLWTKSFGGVYKDEAFAVESTSDDGFIITGSTESYTNGFNDVWLIKTDADGAMQWSNSFGGTSVDYGLDVKECVSGGFIIAGVTEHSITGGRYAWLIRTDEVGNEIWNRRYGGFERDFASSVAQTSDGGFMVTGATGATSTGSAALWLFKVGPNGDAVWERIVNDVVSTSGSRLVIPDDGSIAVIGNAMPDAIQTSNMIFVRIDPTGDVLVNTVLQENAFGTGISATSDGSFIVCGYTNPYGSDGSDIVLSKIGREGNTIWKKLIGGSRLDRARAVITTRDNGYMITGNTRSFGHGDLDMLMLKTDDLGQYAE